VSWFPTIALAAGCIAASWLLGGELIHAVLLYLLLILIDRD
jgi:hypothetical protein